MAIPEVDEASIGQQVLEAGGSPTDYVTALATAKVNVVSDTTFTLGADTVVVHRGRVLGKPANRNAARATLLGMSDGEVEVVSAVALRTGEQVATRVVSTMLTIRPLSPAEVHAYVVTGAADDKAGGLAVQDEAAGFVAAIDGCFTNVVGLPMCAVTNLLEAASSDGLSRPAPEPHHAPECRCPTGS